MKAKFKATIKKKLDHEKIDRAAKKIKDKIAHDK